jgi:hypothetical protein
MLSQFQLSSLKWAQEVHNSERKRKGKPPIDLMPTWKQSVAATHVRYPSEVKPKRSQRKVWK